jgi:hypothetical protein
MTQPIGIAEYEINNAIPKEIKTELPTIEEIELATTSNLRNKVTKVEQKAKKE